MIHNFIQDDYKYTFLLKHINHQNSQHIYCNLKQNKKLMEQFVIKRNGVYKLFAPYKIEDAIIKAFNSVSLEYDQNIYKKVIFAIGNSTSISVEEIQDIIEKEL